MFRLQSTLAPGIIRGMQRSYTVIIHRGEDGWWVANVPLLHATTQGRNRSTALKRAKSLIRFALETIQSEGAERLRLRVPPISMCPGTGSCLSLPAVSKARFARALQKLGFVLERQKGSHQKWRHPDRKVCLCVHASPRRHQAIRFEVDFSGRWYS